MRPIFTVILTFVSISCFAQTTPFGGSDSFGGWTYVKGTGHPHAQSATCNQSGTTQTCTVADGTKFAANEPIMLLSCGNTALNWVYTTDRQQGASLVTSIASNTVTMSSDSSNQMIANTSCTFSPARFYVQTVAATGISNGPKLFTPLSDYLFPVLMTYPQCQTSGGTCAIPKYSNVQCTGVVDEINQWFTWNFNSVGQTSSQFDPSGGVCPTSKKVPFFQENFVSEYSSTNLNSRLTQPVHDLEVGENSNWSTACAVLRPAVDFFDARFAQFGTYWFAPGIAGGVSDNAKSPGLIGEMTDDTGRNMLFDSGGDFHNVPINHVDCHVSMMVLLTSPIQTANAHTFYGGGQAPPFLYPDPLIYSKVPMASPPTACNATTTPCSLYTYLQKKYSTVGALNTAWGSSYTALGSSGACIGYNYAWCGSTAAAEAYGTGDGSTLTFAHTLANHSSVSPFSIMILVAGVEVAGSCPDFALSCSASAGSDQLIGPNIASGSCVRSTGVCTITFTGGNAPGNGVAITADYIQNGWSLGTGFLDEDGHNTSWVGTNAQCLKTKPAWQSTHVYAPGDDPGGIIHDATSGTWQAVVATGTSGGSAPTFSAVQGNITTDGTVVWQSEGKPVCGTEAGSDYGVANMNQTAAADLEAWLSQITLQYYQSTGDVIKSINPDVLYGGTDETGVGFSPARSGVLSVANSKCDWIYFDQLDPTQDPNALAKYLWMTRFYTGPIIDGQQFYSSSQGSGDNSALTNPLFTTNAARGVAWARLQAWITKQLSFNNTTQFAGLAWGASHDIGGCSRCGLKTALDNAYDGTEDVVATVSCSPPNGALSCGGESSMGNFLASDAIGTASSGKILNGNCLWFLCGATPSPNTTTAPAPQMMVHK